LVRGARQRDADLDAVGVAAEGWVPVLQS